MLSPSIDVGTNIVKFTEVAREFNMGRICQLGITEDDDSILIPMSELPGNITD